MSRSIVAWTLAMLAVLCLCAPSVKSVNMAALSNKMENEANQVLSAQEDEEVEARCRTYNQGNNGWERCYSCVIHRGSGKIKRDYPCVESRYQ